MREYDAYKEKAMWSVMPANTRQLMQKWKKRVRLISIENETEIFQDIEDKSLFNKNSVLGGKYEKF